MRIDLLTTRCMRCDGDMGVDHDFNDTVANYAFVFCNYCGSAGPSSQHRHTDESAIEAIHLWNIYNMCIWASEHANQGE